MTRPTIRLALPLAHGKTVDEGEVFRICGWADAGDLDKAGAHAFRLLSTAAGSFQVFAVWLAHRFQLEGVSGLVALVDDLKTQLVFELSSGSVAIRELERNCNWLVDSIAQRVHFNSAARTDAWRRWIAELGPDWLETTSEAIHAALSELDATHAPSHDLAEPLLRLESLVRSAFATVVAELSQAELDRAPIESSPPVAVEAEDAPIDDLFPVDGGADAEARQLVEEAPALSRAPAPPPGRRASEPLLRLIAKLEAFERLAEREAWIEASIVARDIEQELSGFDPLRYLPDVFSGYLRSLHRVGDVLEGHMHEGASLENQALERLYRADPDEFFARLGVAEGSRE